MTTQNAPGMVAFGDDGQSIRGALLQLSPEACADAF
jgi:hypothetical protein